MEPGERVLEIGTGTGFVALHAARVGRVVATDVSPDAVSLARENAAANGLRLAVVRADLFRGLRGAFDVIAFNPPYLAEAIEGDWAARAWQGGSQGDVIIRRFLDGVRDHLGLDGRVYLVVPASLGSVLAAGVGGFRVRSYGSRALFFERLSALELTTGGERRGRLQAEERDAPRATHLPL